MIAMDFSILEWYSRADARSWMVELQIYKGFSYFLKAFGLKGLYRNSIIFIEPVCSNP